MAGVLDGVRVLDLSRGIAGPMVTMLLADHGAAVTRIERPGADPFRSQLGNAGWNRGKKSAVLDLKAEDDRAVFRALVSQTDVLVESFRPGVSERLGVDYEALATPNPRLIYCSITGYGRDNPLSQRPAYDGLVAARLGLQWEQRGRVGGSAAFLSGCEPFSPDYEVPDAARQGAPREGPLFSASRFPSLGAAYAALAAISAALRAREVTGRGQWVETSLLRGALAAGTMSFGMAKKLDAYGYTTWVGDSRSPKGLFECSDGRWIHCWPPNPRFVLAAAEGDEINAAPDLAVREDPDRLGLGPEELFVLHHYWQPMAQAVAKFSADAWTEAGAKAGVCIQKVRSPEECWSDPLLLADGCVAEIEDRERGPIRAAGVLYRLRDHPAQIGASAPEVGADSASIRAEAAAFSASSPEPARPGQILAGGPLEGIRVLDFGLAVAGPYGAQVLSDLGADVVKVNALYDWYWHSNQIAMSCNRGKRSIAIDMKHESAAPVIEDLLAQADVLIHNMRYPAAVKLGIDYEQLKERYPRLVYCHTRGFERGPREFLPGNDQTGSCLAGVEWEDGGCHRGGKPLWSLTSMGDTGNGFLAATAICQALYAREKTGRGQWVETAIVNAQILNASHSVARPDGSGFERPLLDAMQLGFSAGVRLYPTAEGWLCLCLLEDKHWHALSGVIAVPALGSGALWGDAQARQVHDEDLARELEEIFKKKAASDWFALLDAAGVPCEISANDGARKLWDQPEALDNQWVVRYPHPMTEELGQVGLAFQFSDTPAQIQRRPLLVGEHSRELLSELGYQSDRIEALFGAGVVADESCHPALAAEPGQAVKSPWDPS